MGMGMRLPRQQQPATTPPLARAGGGRVGAVIQEPDIAIVGAGAAGIGAAQRLAGSGLTTLRRCRASAAAPGHARPRACRSISVAAGCIRPTAMLGRASPRKPAL